MYSCGADFIEAAGPMQNRLSCITKHVSYFYVRAGVTVKSCLPYTLTEGEGYHFSGRILLGELFLN